MTNMILVILFTMTLCWVIGEGQEKFEKIEKSQKAKGNAEKRYRWSDGRFSKVKTQADLAREIGINE